MPDPRVLTIAEVRMDRAEKFPGEVARLANSLGMTSAQFLEALSAGQIRACPEESTGCILPAGHTGLHTLRDVASEPLAFTVSKASPTKGHERAATFDIFKTDAQKVCAALAHLPQGTIDQVLVLLLEQRASLLRVAQPFPAAPGIPGLPEEPPDVFRSVVAATIEDIRRDDRGETTLPPVTPDGAARGLWFAVRHLVAASAKEGA